MKTEQIIILVVAFFLGMLLLNTIKGVCGCDLVEGLDPHTCKDELALRRNFTICKNSEIDNNTQINQITLGDAGFTRTGWVTKTLGNFGPLKDRLKNKTRWPDWGIDTNSETGCNPTDDKDFITAMTTIMDDLYEEGQTKGKFCEPQQATAVRTEGTGQMCSVSTFNSHLNCSIGSDSNLNTYKYSGSDYQCESTPCTQGECCEHADTCSLWWAGGEWRTSGQESRCDAYDDKPFLKHGTGLDPCISADCDKNDCCDAGCELDPSSTGPLADGVVDRVPKGIRQTFQCLHPEAAGGAPRSISVNCSGEGILTYPDTACPATAPAGGSCNIQFSSPSQCAGAAGGDPSLKIRDLTAVSCVTSDCTQEECCMGFLPESDQNGEPLLNLYPRLFSEPATTNAIYGPGGGGRSQKQYQWYATINQRINNGCDMTNEVERFIPGCGFQLQIVDDTGTCTPRDGNNLLTDEIICYPSNGVPDSTGKGDIVFPTTAQGTCGAPDYTR